MSTSHAAAAALNTSALPARQGSLAGQGDTAQQQAAWQKEMERAQMATWFKPPVVAANGNAAAPSVKPPEAPTRNGMIAAAQSPGAIMGGNSPAVGSQPALALEPVAASPRMGEADVFEGAAQTRCAAVRFFTEARPAGITEALPEARASVDVQMRRLGNLFRLNDEFAAGSDPNAEVEATAESREQQPPPPDAEAPLRLHEESMPEGQAVWIAMRADDAALAAMLPRIVGDLQRGMLQDRGQRLYQVVCNGRLVWRAEPEASLAGNTSISDGCSPSVVVDSFHSNKGA
ncbi:hypothetical protein FB547_105251 [Variovorax beijingensis]|uniref:Uncharacterized protein n=1 Tax=Variovorax beijingensis TaxID=2496117 RepID=A0A561C3G5_9BURK|nr:hypothetical protein [Variovorax beijingensis]TWD85739.1 hypothetical protein FB547_105251 [Variovorax beijingensis]